MARYLTLYESGELAERVERARAALHDCRLCGWDCGIDRAEELGPCRTGLKAIVSTAYVHHGEERPLVVGGGSGAIFFANCDLRCQFCQTARWNIRGAGRDATPAQIASLMLSLQEKGARNFNVVTPSHVAAQILAALLIHVGKGLSMPHVWNSGGYDSPQTLALLDGVVDIYLPDMKYSDALMGRRMSAVRDYPRVNQAAVAEMHRQVGDLVRGDDGGAISGVLVRHLVMPGHLQNTFGVLDWIAERLGPNTYLSLMDQYRPAYRASARDDINRPLHPDEFAQALAYARDKGLTRLDDHLLNTTLETESHG
ncbi:MAG: radical SAM protein [Anaerolineae bacterium]